ncbi:MAG TPA: D-alanyl-D-alanine carboxypeptidase/D-alanyl-D-alanine-endopeptidase, partial [Vicinamibacteria bacterium]
MARPEFAHASFGIEFYAPETGEVVFALNEHRLFTPASTTKLLTEGTLLASLGADHRFHTRIYRTGEVDGKGRLKGDLILVASGDPNLSNRGRSDGTLAFADEDHSYGGPAVEGDPLLVIRKLARDVAGKGIRKIQGRVLVDASLLPDGPREGGTNVVISSIVVNDNVIDLVIHPGAKVGDAVALSTSPQTSYIRFVNQMTTSPADGKPEYENPEERILPDGTVSVTLRGKIPLGAAEVTAPYPVPSPTRFAETVFSEALTEEGVEIRSPSKTAAFDLAGGSRFYVAENQVAEHVSAPLSEEIKVTLKVSQNLHAGLGPYLLGALVAKDSKDPLRAGFKVEREFLETAKLDLTGASQGDGEGGDWADLFSPHFMCRYLSYWTTRPDFDVLFRALPVLGKDGTLAKIQRDSPAAGHVFAKTGTFGSEDKLGGKGMLNGKGLAGYVVTASGRRLAFAAYVNHVHLSDDPEAAQTVAGEALGAIAAAAYDAPLESTDSADFDVLIRNGRVVDGTGNPWYRADVGIKGDRILEIGDLRGRKAAKEIDATGRVVSPGFIDMLGQSEISLLLDKRAVSKLAQGITTEITGEGASIAPQNEKTLRPAQPVLARIGLTVDWTTLDGYFRRLERQGTALNLGTYVGSAQVREAVVGDDDRAPTPEELEEMKALVEQAMKDGALG